MCVAGRFREDAGGFSTGAAATGLLASGAEVVTGTVAGGAVSGVGVRVAVGATGFGSGVATGVTTALAFAGGEGGVFVEGLATVPVETTAATVSVACVAVVLVTVVVFSVTGGATGSAIVSVDATVVAGDAEGEPGSVGTVRSALQAPSIAVNTSMATRTRCCIDGLLPRTARRDHSASAGVENEGRGAQVNVMPA